MHSYAFCFPTDHPHILKKNILTEDSNFIRAKLVVATSLFAAQFGASELSDITGFLELPDGKASSWSPSGPSSVLGWGVMSDWPRHFQFPPSHVGWRVPCHHPASPGSHWLRVRSCCDWTPAWWWWEIKDISSDFPNTTQSAFDEVKFTFCGVCKTSSNVSTAGWSYDKPWKKSNGSNLTLTNRECSLSIKTSCFFTWKLSKPHRQAFTKSIGCIRSDGNS